MPNPVSRVLNEVVWAVIPKRAKRDLMLAYLSEHSGEFDEEGEGWLKLGGSATIRELDEATRQQLIQLSYYYWRNDPVMARAVTLTRDYTMGRGITWRAKDEGTKAIIRRFWDSSNNKCLTRAIGQWELMERIILAGEVFLVFFVSKATGEVTVRIIEPEEITQVIPRDDDKTVTTYYERTADQAAYNWAGHTFGAGTQKKDYYPDWQWPDLQHSTVESQGTYVCIHHIKTNSHGLRGVPVYGRIIQWVRSYKGFMEDRLTLTLAAATLAFKQKIKGSVDAVRRLASQWANVSFLRRYRVAGGGQELGAENAAGARVMVENEAASLEQFQVNTNASNAYLDGRMIRQQVAAGTGITEPNLMGDPSVGNLASLTSMDGVMLKTFESWQQFWHDELLDVMSFIVDVSEIWGDKRPGQDRKVEIDFPPIVTKDLPVVISAVSALITAQTAAGQQYIGPRRLATYILQAFGENDIDAALTELVFKEQPTPPVPATVQQPVQASQASDDGDLKNVLDSLRAIAGGIRDRLHESSQPLAPQPAPQFIINPPPQQITVNAPPPPASEPAQVNVTVPARESGPPPVFNLYADVHLPEQPAAQMTIQLPEAAPQPAANIVVNVPPQPPTPVTVINQMPEQPAPSVFVSVPPAEPPTDLTSVVVERDSSGQIVRFKTNAD